jgi:hypothetical protein
MHILYVTRIPPFPINGGAQIRAYGLLKALSQISDKVSAVFPNPDGVDFRNYDLENVVFYEHKFPREYPIYGLFYHHFSDKKAFQIFELIHKKNPVDIVVLDFWFMGHLITWFKKRGISVIYGTHNSQADLAKQRKSKNPLMRAYLFLDYLSKKFHERRFFNRADVLLVVSDRDKIYHEKFVNSEKIKIIPNFLDESMYKLCSNTKSDYFVISANFNVFMNDNGLKWFLKYVWDEELSERIKILLVGRGSKEALARYQHRYYTRNISATGMVADVVPYIAGAKASLIPLLHGSGTRLKCLEAMALKTQLIATSKGAEGILNDENSICIADKPQEFKNMMLTVNAGLVDHTESAFDLFKTHYSLQAVKPKLAKIINALMNS